MSKFLVIDKIMRYVAILTFAATLYTHGSGIIGNEMARNISGILFGFGTGTIGALLIYER